MIECALPEFYLIISLQLPVHSRQHACALQHHEIGSYSEACLVYMACWLSVVSNVGMRCYPPQNDAKSPDRRQLPRFLLIGYPITVRKLKHPHLFSEGRLNSETNKYLYLYGSCRFNRGRLSFVILVRFHSSSYGTEGTLPQVIKELEYLYR